MSHETRYSVTFQRMLIRKKKKKTKQNNPSSTTTCEVKRITVLQASYAYLEHGDQTTRIYVLNVLEKHISRVRRWKYINYSKIHIQLITVSYPVTYLTQIGQQWATLTVYVFLCNTHRLCLFFFSPCLYCTTTNRIRVSDCGIIFVIMFFWALLFLFLICIYQVTIELYGKNKLPLSFLCVLENH